MSIGPLYDAGYSAGWEDGQKQGEENMRHEIEQLRAALSEFEELKRIAADSRYSSELIGIRLRNLANRQNISVTSEPK